MAELHLAENLVFLRKERGITQEVLAEFLGVSKASVSKWETGQTFPDILTLPRLASYFNRSIDELMGYEAQLDQKRIRKIYFMLAEKFAEKPFEEAYKETVKWTKEYYSCYPFLQQIAILLSNHYMLAADEVRRKDVLEYAITLVKRVCANSDDVILCRNALTVEGMLYIMKGNPQETLRLLGGKIEPYMGNDELMAMAYQMTGEKEMAVLTIEVCMYQKLASILQMGTGLIDNMQENEEKTMQIILRMQALIDAFKWDRVNPGNAMSFYLQAATMLCKQGKQDQAVGILQRYVETVRNFAECPNLHGDEFFDQVDSWIEQIDLGGKTVRQKSVVLTSIQKLFEGPLFQTLAKRSDYKILKKELDNLVRGK